MKKKISVLLKVIAVAGLLYCFLVSIGLMGDAFKGFGKGFAQELIRTTNNPFIGLFIGILATSLIQSSSTTTSIVVGMVGAQIVVDGAAQPVLSVQNAIPIIMGANIGTTVTNTLVSMGHVGRREEFRRAIGAATVHDFFNLICVAVLFPLEQATHFLERGATRMAAAFEGAGGVSFTSPVKAITKPTVHLIEDAAHAVTGSGLFSFIVMLILSIFILFFALYFIVTLMKSLVVDRAEIVLNNVISKSPILGMLAGWAFTTIVQSSSITTSLMIPLVAAGILTLETVFPITIGANVGTTMTAILASFAADQPAAVVIAFAHFLFNITGTVLIYPIRAIRMIPITLARSLGDLAARKRRYAIIYVLGLFFALPITLILISKLFK